MCRFLDGLSYASNVDTDICFGTEIGATKHTHEDKVGRYLGDWTLWPFRTFGNSMGAFFDQGRDAMWIFLDLESKSANFFDLERKMQNFLAGGCNFKLRRTLQDIAERHWNPKI